MNQTKINKLNATVKNHRQFIHSQLWDDIMTVLKCDIETAEQKAKTHCNMVSTYSMITASGNYFDTYADFFKFCLYNKYCDESGYIGGTKGKDKEQLFEELGIISSFKQFKSMDVSKLNPDKFYWIKMKADTGGFHFVSAYVQNGKLYISCSSYRGNPAEAAKYLNAKNFIWIMECC